mmetsp:Transcript_25469/g.35087  ORF Transcript_25469/g.35087 Transcript_25469/m.35087 type:complete len:254 (-) Transcript_25469:130-891(-)|eukprot:CAMPEP_0196573060 /NCGR_PEP_ID=MMETSP1081-20130531/3024_1 /TAXON_ID=36882 /ORGANISM="Pyramimonas amylifera, Strain CCMP720" /LENGTH=253 /DNA_ID=CAMNT_0041890629 /DNA_START=115 /DNA_END=876 /DNA_ORIENTATION=-
MYALYKTRGVRVTPVQERKGNHSYFPAFQFSSNILNAKSKTQLAKIKNCIVKSNADGQNEAETIEFESKLGQNIRKGMDGWQTLVQVERSKPSEEVSDGAEEGDDVTVDFVCTTEGGTVLASSDDDGPLTFEVGTRDFIGNPLFQGVDEAIRGFVVGQSSVVKACGGTYDPELLFKVPVAHPEILRLSEEYGQAEGLQPGLPVQLANGAAAVILNTDYEFVTIDSNHPLAGAPLLLNVTLVEINKGAGTMSKK